jgi:hypothetical protein
MMGKKTNASRDSRIARDILMDSLITLPAHKQARIDDIPAWIGKAAGGSAGGKDGDCEADGVIERVGAEVLVAGPGEDEDAFAESGGSQGPGAQVPGAGPGAPVSFGRVFLFPGQGPTVPTGVGEVASIFRDHGYSTVSGSRPFLF